MAESRHFSIVVTDIEGSSGLSGPDKVTIREDVYRMLDSALLESEISPSAVVREDRGDGVFMLVSADVPIRRLIHPFVGVIDAALAARRVGDSKLRLRLVVHQGQATLDTNGSSGAAVDRAFAMLDALQLKETLEEAASGRLALAVVDDIYQQVVLGHPDPDPTKFRKRMITVKGGAKIRIWITVTGTARQPSGRHIPAGPAPRRDLTPSMSIHNESVNVKKAKNYGIIGGVRGDVSLGDQRRPGGDR